MIKKNFIFLFVSKILFHYLNNIVFGSILYEYIPKNLDFAFDFIVINLYMHLLKKKVFLIKNTFFLSMLLVIYAPEFIFCFIILFIGCIVIFWMLICWIYKFSFKNEYPIFYIIIKYAIFILFLIFLFNLFILITYLFAILFSIIKYNVLAKLRVLKDLVESKYKKDFKNPNPKKFPFLHFISDLRKKRKLENLKKNVAKKQAYNYTNNVINRNNGNTNNNGFIKRNWNNTLNIKEEFLTKADVLKNIEEKFEFYTDQKERFLQTIKNIKENKENFYSNDSAVLFKEYLKLIDFINAELKTMEQQVKGSKKI